MFAIAESPGDFFLRTFARAAEGQGESSVATQSAATGGVCTSAPAASSGGGNRFIGQGQVCTPASAAHSRGGNRIYSLGQGQHLVTQPGICNVL